VHVSPFETRGKAPRNSTDIMLDSTSKAYTIKRNFVTASNSLTSFIFKKISLLTARSDGMLSLTAISIHVHQKNEAVFLLCEKGQHHQHLIIVRKVFAVKQSSIGGTDVSLADGRQGMRVIQFSKGCLSG